jgi:hypothetical protein
MIRHACAAASPSRKVTAARVSQALSSHSREAAEFFAVYLRNDTGAAGRLRVLLFGPIAAEVYDQTHDENNGYDDRKYHQDSLVLFEKARAPGYQCGCGRRRRRRRRRTRTVVPRSRARDHAVVSIVKSR